jgi:hypothetical protein
LALSFTGRPFVRHSWFSQGRAAHLASLLAKYQNIDSVPDLEGLFDAFGFIALKVKPASGGQFSLP